MFVFGVGKDDPGRLRWASLVTTIKYVSALTAKNLPFYLIPLSAFPYGKHTSIKK